LEAAMIARIWSGRVRARDARRYGAYLRRTGMADYKATPGNRGVLLLSRRDGGEVEFTFITLWDSVAAIRRFAGKDYDRARYYPEDRRFLLHRSRKVRHYDIAERSL
jgi:heme-degrading monooxygenase HmoA